MKKLLNDKKAITLIALVITIVVLVILAAVIISISLGNDGLISRAIKAANGYKNAQERDKQAINDLYGQLSIATDGTISGLTVDSLKNLITTQVQAETESMQSTITTLNTKVAALESNNNTRTLATSNGTKYKNVTAEWTELEQVSLSGHGHGKAIVTLEVATPTATTTISAQILTNNDSEKCFTRTASTTNSGNAWLGTECTTVMPYNENTIIKFRGCSTLPSTSTATEVSVRYRYNILYLPEA